MQASTCVTIAVAVALAGCGNDPPEREPIDPSSAAMFRGYAAVQDELYATFIADGTPFELYRYLGTSGDELSKLVGRPDGFGVQYDVRNARPNAMNVLVWRMMLRSFANDLAATCTGSSAIALNDRAAGVVRSLCAWPAVDDRALGDAWDLVIGYRAAKPSRDAFVAFAHHAATLPDVWLAALLHPAFLLEH